jgi:hypothetical protein
VPREAADVGGAGGDHLPKGTDLAGYTQIDLDAIADELNTRPRKTLHYRTPAEAINDHLIATADLHRLALTVAMV